MSLSAFRDEIVKRLQEKLDAAAGRAINMRVHAESRADTYALVQSDTLSEARTYGEAINVVTKAYQQLVDVPTKEPAPEPEKPKPGERSIYG